MIIEVYEYLNDKQNLQRETYELPDECKRILVWMENPFKEQPKVTAELNNTIVFGHLIDVDKDVIFLAQS